MDGLCLGRLVRVYIIIVTSILGERVLAALPEQAEGGSPAPRSGSIASRPFWSAEAAIRRPASRMSRISGASRTPMDAVSRK